ncbi:23S rRNA (adenine(2503)-C(2))-methyltransferase RlmN [Elusimicrobiota bacterium]
MDIKRLKSALKAEGEPEYRLGQVLRAVYRAGAGSYDEISVLPSKLRLLLKRRVPMMSVSPRRVLTSSDGRARKALLELRDGEFVESVLIKPKPGPAWSACISCQVGCAVRCSFCATGRMGLRRNLTSEEIADQALFWRQHLRAEGISGKLTNVVYMGMGEPLHCLDAVFASIRTLLDPALLGLSARHVSVSTAGIVPGIDRMITEFPQVNLALSLHAADDDLRSRLVPINKVYPLNELAAVLERVLRDTKRKVFLEYVLLDGINDSPWHARQVSHFIGAVGRPDLLPVNLIGFNPTGTTRRSPPPWKVTGFRDALRRFGVCVTIRRSLGADIRASCGQLATGTKKSRTLRSPKRKKRPKKKSS